MIERGDKMAADQRRRSPLTRRVRSTADRAVQTVPRAATCTSSAREPGAAPCHRQPAPVKASLLILSLQRLISQS